MAINTPGEKHHPCNKECESTFASKSYLDDHLRRMHEAKPFECESCKETFQMKRQLKHHMNTKHEINTCPHCGKHEYNRSKLIVHIRTHTGK